MRKTLNKAIGNMRQLRYSKQIETVPRKHTTLHVPYFAQWESPKLIESIITTKIEAVEDPNWKLSGAKSKDEYALWASNACGMACTKMILTKELGKVIPIVELANRSLPYGVYTMPLENSAGLLYRPYIKYLAEEFNIQATLVLPLAINQIVYELSKNDYVIASVSPKIRHTNDTPPSKGGHLILVLGYNLDKQELYFHNPSGFNKSTQEYASISFKDFAKFFAGRGIVVRSSKHIQ